LDQRGTCAAAAAIVAVNPDTVVNPSIKINVVIPNVIV
jgi:hypothetical protein